MVSAFFIEHQGAILFYTILIALIVMFRDKLDWQAFGIGLYKTKVGLGLMKSWGTKYGKLVRWLGYVGIVAGFAGMALIMYILVEGFFKMWGAPDGPPVIAPVVPGFNIFGHGIKVPLITGWLALFVVIVIHEFSHGVVSIAHKVKVKSSGLLVFGPIAGAFVEPDEKKLEKKPKKVQLSLFAAGPWSNIISGFLFYLVILLVLPPLYTALTVPVGVEVVDVQSGYPAEGVLEPGMTITELNGEGIRSNEDLAAVLSNVQPGEEVTLLTDRGVFSVVTAEHPAGEEYGYIGFTPSSRRDPVSSGFLYVFAAETVLWLNEFLFWVFILSLGIGLANLLPIGPVDGGRMLQSAARYLTGDDERGDWWWKKVSVAVLALIIILLLVPFSRWIFGIA